MQGTRSALRAVAQGGTTDGALHFLTELSSSDLNHFDAAYPGALLLLFVAGFPA
jgi:hypothetical protein